MIEESNKMKTEEACCKNQIVPFFSDSAASRKRLESNGLSVSIQGQNGCLKDRARYSKLSIVFAALMMMTLLLFNPVMVDSALNHKLFFRQSPFPKILQADQHQITSNSAENDAKLSLNDKEMAYMLYQLSQKSTGPADPKESKENKAQVYAEHTDHAAEKISLSPYENIIRNVAERYDIDPALIQAIIMIESSNNPDAVSKSGAKGLMQLMPATAEEVGVEDIFNPQHNIEGGTKYLHRMMTRFDGDITLALAAYNAGSRHVLNYGGVPPFKETRQYVKKVLACYAAYKVKM